MNVTIAELRKQATTHTLLGTNKKENPFTVDDYGDLFVRFDGLEIKNLENGAEAVTVIFSWRGNPMYSIRIDGTQITTNTTLRIGGIEGAQRVNTLAPV